MGQIFDTLWDLGLAAAETRERFADRTRDVDPLAVWRDTVSEVIYIDDYYVGESTYVSGDYRLAKGYPHYERFTDMQRRAAVFRPYYMGKRICDVGCGEGDFLTEVQGRCTQACGVEIERVQAETLRERGIDVRDAIGEFDEAFDVVFLFHALEHFPDPRGMLRACREKLVPGGRIVIEVPHARDALLTLYGSEAFRDFTLWSQHLILHTRDSLRRFLVAEGFDGIEVEGFQRYPLSNHLHWLARAKPGGHKSTFGVLDTPGLVEHYAAALKGLDRTDTLVATAIAP